MPSGDEDARAEEVELFVVPVKDRSRALLGHPLDGRFRPMDPNRLHDVVVRLAALVDRSEIDYVLGIPEGGTIVAFEFARIAGLPLVLSSRMQADVPGAIYFEEAHSVTADRDNFVYGLKPGDRVVIVDDEITTGHTLVNAAHALRDAGIAVDLIVVLFANDDSETVARMSGAGLSVISAFAMPAETGREITGAAAAS